MKKIFLLFAFAITASAAFSQTIFTYGNNAVDKAEFLRAYEKNRTPVTDKEKALREYLDLYIKFKLKVKAAMDLKLDTLPQLIYDAQSFRSQIEQSYLNNDKVVESLITEAYNRGKKDLHVLHFFVKTDASMNPADTMKAYNAIHNIYKTLSSGKTDYANIIAAEPGASQSDLGYITVFTLPYDYENIIYNLKEGQVNKPYRSKSGWHIFKLIGERDAIGKWKIAQILFSIPPDATETDKKNYESRADSVYHLLVNGGDFGKLARQFSDDKITYGNNGNLPEFGSGKYDVAFENEILKLTKDGEISKPFLSPYGYHIVKRISQTPVPASITDPAYQFDLKLKTEQDSRINIAKELFTQEILKRVNFKKTTTVSKADLSRFADSVIANPNIETSNKVKFPITEKVIGTYTNRKLTGKDWLDFVRSYKGGGELYQGENNEALFEKFISTSVVEDYKKHLEDYNTEFKYQMEEFKDGNVLFEIMEHNIWEKAATDTAGLKKLYAENKSKYLWEASADIVLFSCANKVLANEVKASLSKGEDWKKVAETNINIQADSGRFELSQLPLKISPQTAPIGKLTDDTVNPVDGNTSFIKPIRYYDAGMQRNFDEARGSVINDYQNILEENWIKELKKQYPVKINEAVFNSLLK